MPWRWKSSSAWRLLLAASISASLSELARIFDHLTCCRMAASELGAITVGFYMIEARELVMRIIKSDRRATHRYLCPIGGVKHDLLDEFAARVNQTFKTVRKLMDDCDRLLSRNRIFIDRMSNVGTISQETAISYCLTGPILRATGVIDIRKAYPYLVYDQLDFTVPLGSRGDNYDRFVCRIQEIEQSMGIVEQALAKLPLGPVWIDDPRFVLPEKDKVYNSIEGLMHHFKIIMERIHCQGETYFAVEGGNGELGFYIAGDGAPPRIRVRPPCFIAMGAFHEMIKGYMIADIIPTFGMVNMIGGECDR